MTIHAFIDESGQRGHSELSSPHFLLGAAVVRDRNSDRLPEALELLRADLGRPSGAYLTWKNVRSHSDRLQIAETIGSQPWLQTITVVACKQHLDPGAMSVDEMYLYQLRFLLERLSWLARKHGEIAEYTLAHIRGFKLEKLREYEHRLRRTQSEIKWDYLSASGGAIDQPQRNERLQFADLVVSAQAQAFNPDRFGRTERRYLEATVPTIYRHTASSNLTSYGLKIHPWTESTKAAYPWATAL